MERLQNPHVRPGVIAAVAVVALDQASKLWLLFVFDIARRGAVKVTPFFVLVLWMARSRTLLATIALGLIIGGAIGNGIDRFAYGAVVDFALFHLQIGGNTYNWYVFNLADVAIVAGVAALLYDSFLGVAAAKAP